MRPFLVFFILFLSIDLSHATGQQAELILYNGDTLQLLSLPLEEYLGKYENRQERSIFKELFDSESPIMANWFTGNLFIQQGNMIKYHHSGFERYFEEEIKIEIVEGKQISLQHFINGYQPNDENFPTNPDSLIAEIHRRINWNNLPKMSKDYKVFISVKTGEIDSLSIVKSIAPKLYVKEVRRVLDEFPDLRKFYSRGKPLEERYILPVIFSNAQRLKFAR